MSRSDQDLTLAQSPEQVRRGVNNTSPILQGRACSQRCRQAPNGGANGGSGGDRCGEGPVGHRRRADGRDLGGVALAGRPAVLAGATPAAAAHPRRAGSQRHGPDSSAVSAASCPLGSTPPTPGESSRDSSATAGSPAPSDLRAVAAQAAPPRTRPPPVPPTPGPAAQSPEPQIGQRSVGCALRVTAAPSLHWSKLHVIAGDAGRKLRFDSPCLPGQTAPFPAACRCRTSARLLEITWCCWGFDAGEYTWSACS